MRAQREREREPAKEMSSIQKMSVIYGNIGYTGKCPLYTETSDITSTRTKVAAISDVLVIPDIGYNDTKIHVPRVAAITGVYCNTCEEISRRNWTGSMLYPSTTGLGSLIHSPENLMTLSTLLFIKYLSLFPCLK